MLIRTGIFSKFACFQTTRHSCSYERMPFSGTWRRVGHVRTDVSDECVASIFRVETISDLGTLEVSSKEKLVTANVVTNSSIVSATRMEIRSSFETSVIKRHSRRHIQEDGIPHSYNHETFKSYSYLFIYTYIVFILLCFVLISTCFERHPTSSTRCTMPYSI
jgi:hypothetical protein